MRHQMELEAQVHQGPILGLQVLVQRHAASNVIHLESEWFWPLADLP